MVSFNVKKPPRKFKVGADLSITISDCCSVELQPDEQVTFVSIDEKEYDVAAKSWGYYATPSVNKRLKSFGYSTALVVNSFGAIYVMIVDVNKMDDFADYCNKESQTVLEWISDR